MARNRNQYPQTGLNLSRDTIDLYNTNLVYRQKWRNYIDKILLNRINWINLPDTIDERFLERTLVRYGKAVFYEGSFSGTGVPVNYDERVFLATRVVTEGTMDIYDNYNKYMSLGNNFSRQIPDGEGVLIWNSTTRRDDWGVLNQYSIDLADIDTTAKINRNQQRWAIMLTSKQENFNDIIKLQREMDEGKIVISALKNIVDDITINKLDLTVPYKAEQFNADKENMLRELSTYLGVIMPKDKASYVNNTEVEMNNDTLARIREDILFPRKQACSVINKKWGLEIDVEWRNDAFNEVINPENPNDENTIDEDIEENV